MTTMRTEDDWKEIQETSTRKRSRSWVWTLFGYSSQDIDRLANLDLPHLKYLVFGVESAPSTGRAHLQGYVNFTRALSMRQVKELIHGGAYLAIAEGNAQQNRLYCLKLRPEDEKPNEEFYEIGLCPQQGKRTDLDAVKEAIESGASDRQIALTHFSQWVKYRKSFKEFRIMMNSPSSIPRYSLNSFPEEWRRISSNDIKTAIFWGSTGIGKTQFAKALLPKALFVSHVDDLLRYDITEHNGIIFDDMDFNHFPRTSQIHLTDWEETRSVHCRFHCAVIPAETQKIFTTNETDGRIFDLEDGAVRRRVKVYHLEKFFQ
jgi:hypothetical protein